MAGDRIEVREYGREHGNAPLVVVHGGPGAPGSARGLALALAQRHWVLEPLQRPSGGEPLTVARHVEDLAHVAPPRAVLIGHSWGAMLALSFAALQPARVRALVLVGSGTYGTTARAAYQRAFAKALGPDRAARRDQLLESLGRAASDGERNRIRAELGALASDVMSFDAIPDRAAYEHVDERSLQETWQDAMQLQEQGIEPARFAAIRAPTLMLHGDDDPHPGLLTQHALRPYLPQLRYVGFARCGHEPWRERQAKDAFLHVLFEWLAQPR